MAAARLLSQEGDTLRVAYDVYFISYDDNGEQVKEYWGEQTYVLKNTADGWRVDDWEDINW